MISKFLLLSVICWAITMVAADEVAELEGKLSTMTNLTWIYVAAHIVIILVKVFMFFFYKRKISKVEKEQHIYDDMDVAERTDYLHMKGGKEVKVESKNRTQYDELHANK